MKNLKVTTGIILVAFLALSAMSCKNETKKENDTIIAEVAQNLTTISFGVRGNCGMCKKNIEKAANAVDGVTNAVWDVEKKKIDVIYNNTKTNEMAIHNAVAMSGYDTEKVSGNTEAYNGLPGCCQYDHEMEMNQMK
ncbi:heavy-metal-associated domain-containing protein [Mariniflexile gromovii]|uniref:Heavy-metal-associated domain-containing protein n=1 Tax=Mariniflexile gromovii TaxID=362523 RepID=A0ABS4BNS0_9FLAO|nr:heavy-metal-associated domain-containing protein [Mariniflexile gromovii]MBP0902243.1 heavy-metal-associated domain-containing protein [Mariniflexile gromovii]